MLTSINHLLRNRPKLKSCRLFRMSEGKSGRLHELMRKIVTGAHAFER